MSIVGAALCTHIPRLMLSEDARARFAPGSTLHEAMTELRRTQLDPLAFDTLLIVDTHWVSVLEYLVDGRAHHKGVYCSDEVPFLIGAVPYDHEGDRPLALSVGEDAAGPRVRVADAAGMPLQYPTVNTLRYLDPDGRRRVLRTSVAQTSSIENDLEFGAKLGRAVRATNRSVVLIASGGLSHQMWPFDALVEHTEPGAEHIVSPEHRAFDARIIELLARGDHRAVVDCTEAYRAKYAPEGRFSHYLIMLGALGGPEICRARATQFGQYENAVGTGQIVLWFDVDRS